MIEKLYVPSLDWWFSLDIGERNYYLNEISEGRPAPKEVIKTKDYCLQKYRLYDYDGNPLDQVTEINLPEEAGEFSLGSFTELKKLTVNIPDYMSVPSNGCFPNIGKYFSMHSGRNTSNIVSETILSPYDDFYKPTSDTFFGYSESHSGNIGKSFYIPKLEELIINSKKITANTIPLFRYLTKLTLNVDEILGSSSIVPGNTGYQNSTGELEVILNNTNYICESAFNSGNITVLSLENSKITTLRSARNQCLLLKKIISPNYSNKNRRVSSLL